MTSMDRIDCPPTVVIERYTDSHALAAHLANLGELGDAMLATADVTGELLGHVSEDLRANLANSPVRATARSCRCDLRSSTRHHACPGRQLGASR